MNALVVNASRGYNLAFHRLAAWLGQRGDTVMAFDRHTLPGDLDLRWACRRTERGLGRAGDRHCPVARHSPVPHGQAEAARDDVDQPGMP